MQSARGAALRRAGLARLVAVTLALAVPATDAEPLPAGGREAPSRALLQTDAAATCVARALPLRLERNT
jgi:hypothetical protein